MLFLALTNVNFQFGVKKLTQKAYTIAEALPTIIWIKLIDEREFDKIALDQNLGTFIIHVSNLEATTIYTFWAAQIAALQWDKAPTKILVEYSNYVDVYLRQNKYAFYGLIYALSLVELETLKDYIKIHLKIGSIELFISLQVLPSFLTKYVIVALDY